MIGLREQSTQYIAPPPREDDTETYEYKFTLRQLSVRNPYQWCRSRVAAWMEAETGVTEADYHNKAKTATLPVETFSAATDILLIGAAWSHIYASLAKIERRTVKVEDFESVSEWQTIEIPETWKEPSSFIEAEPPDLISELERVAVAVNPTFSFRQDETSKNFGVRRSNGQSEKLKNSAKRVKRLTTSTKRSAD